MLPGIFTSTEYNPAYNMALHNEMSYSRDMPSHIAFCCVHAPAAGTGQTSIADSTKILHSLEPELVQRFEQRGGVKYVVNSPGGADGVGIPWQAMYRTDDREVTDATDSGSQCVVE